MKKIFIVVTLIMASLMLVSCDDKLERRTEGRKTVEVTHTISKKTADIDKDGNPVYIETIKTDEFLNLPIRVAIFNYDVLDILNVSGIEDAGIEKLALPKSNIPESLSSFSNRKYIDIGTLFVPNYDNLDLFNPELIIIGGRTANLYDELKSKYQHADVLDVSIEGTSYTKDLTENVNNLMKIFPTIADNLSLKLDKLNKEIETNRTLIDQANVNALFIMLNGKDLMFYGSQGRYGFFYSEFGFKVPSNLPEEIIDTHGGKISHEIILLINPDTIYLLDRGGAVNADPTINEFISNSIVKTTNAFSNNNIFSLDGEAWYLTTGGFTATNQMIKDVSWSKITGF